MATPSPAHSLPGRVLTKIGSGLINLGKKLSPSAREAEKQRYFDDERKHHLRTDYPLNEQSIVFDVGGYEGQWASDIFARFSCTIHVFEPVKAFADAIQARFAQNPRIHVHNYGLGAKTERVQINLLDNGTSLFRDDHAERETIQLRDIAEVMKELEVNRIDLIKINIEGGEYPLLHRLSELKRLKDITDLQIQFHDFVPNATQALEAAYSELNATHHPTYQYKFIWDNWRRNTN